MLVGLPICAKICMLTWRVSLKAPRQLGPVFQSWLEVSPLKQNFSKYKILTHTG